MSTLHEAQHRASQRLRRAAIGVLLTVGLFALFVVGLALRALWRAA